METMSTIPTIPSIPEIVFPGSGNLLEKTASAADSSVRLPFQSLFEDAVNNVQQAETAKNSEVEKLATGRTDNLHDAVIASQKYSLSVDLLVQLRNKALDAYKEIMQISV